MAQMIVAAPGDSPDGNIRLRDQLLGQVTSRKATDPRDESPQRHGCRSAAPLTPSL